MSELRIAIDQMLLERAREMRHDPAPAEQKLWRCLRDRQLGGFKFRRQHPLGGYIADFYCAEALLVVELDGASHGDRAAYDDRRTRRLQRDGRDVIRFVNDDVFWHIDAVLQVILDECVRSKAKRSRPSPRPSPRVQGEGEMQ
jgi:very-short-patch-repair endonuclease